MAGRGFSRTARLGVSLVLDTGPLLAALDTDDPHHARCVELITGAGEDLTVPCFVLVEIDYWLRKAGRVSVWQAFVDDVGTGSYRVHYPSDGELTRAAELEAQYDDLGLGLVDASVVAACETLGETKVATIDHRHFAIVRPRHCDALMLLPE